MHCDFILGPRGFGYCIIPGSLGPVPGPLALMIGGELPSLALPSANCSKAVRSPKCVTCRPWSLACCCILMVRRGVRLNMTLRDTFLLDNFGEEDMPIELSTVASKAGQSAVF